MPGVFIPVYEQAFTATDTVSITHSLARRGLQARVVVGGSDRSDLVASVNPDPTDALDTLIVKLTSGQSGIIQLFDAPHVATEGPKTITTTDPIATDDVDSGYAIGDLWFNSTAKILHVCSDNTSGAAVWQVTSMVPLRVAVTGSVTNFTTSPTVIAGMTLTVPTPGVWDFRFSSPMAGLSASAQTMIARFAVNGTSVYSQSLVHAGFSALKSVGGEISQQLSGLAVNDVVTVEFYLGVAGGSDYIASGSREFTGRKVRN